jgi:hypothetical protein
MAEHVDVHRGSHKDRHLAERKVARSRLSAIPAAIFAMVLAVAGAIRIRSAHRPRSIWLFQLPSPGLKKSVRTGFLDKVDRVRGVIKSLA